MFLLFWNCLSISLPNGDDVVVDNDEKKDDDVNDTGLEQREPEGKMRGQEQQIGWDWLSKVMEANHSKF